MGKGIFGLHSFDAWSCRLSWDATILVLEVIIFFLIFIVLGLDRYFLEELGCILKFTLRRRFVEGFMGNFDLKRVIITCSRALSLFEIIICSKDTLSLEQ